MARRKKRSNDNKTRVFLKYFIIFIISAAVLYGFYNRTVYFFQHASIFFIDEVVKSPSLQFIKSRHLDILEGKNIFMVDLKGVERRVQSEYPSVDQLRIVRQLPNRILVTAEKRDPFIVVSLGSQDVVLDERGVVLGSGVDFGGALPYVIGLEVVEAVQGKRLLSQRIDVALKILNGIKRNNYLNKLSVKSIDLQNLSKIHVYIDNIDIVVDRFKIDEKVDMLGLLLSDAGVPIEEINYLDLRFKEPIINKK